MKEIDIPDKFPIPFADSAGIGYVRDIPVESQIGITDGAASLTDGWPPVTFDDKAVGGVPPSGLDANGLQKQITANIRWFSSGMKSKYDASFSSSIGGYPQNSILQSDDGLILFRSLMDDNEDNPNIDQTNWAVQHKGQTNLVSISTTQDFTVPAGIYSLDVEGWGGGGGGGGSGSGGGTAGGGGGGAYFRKIVSVVPGQVITCTIGSGGTGGGAGGSGGSGGTTSFGIIASATGGGGGSVNPAGSGGGGGTATGGTINISGPIGSSGSSTNSIGGPGGGSPCGGPGGGGGAGIAGGGAIPGGGGGGGGVSSTGGSGGYGRIHIKY